jgi:hypothetical protein
MTETILTILVFVFVFGTIAVVGYALWACTPFPHRANPYRDSTGRRRWQSPHLDDPSHDLD